MERVDKEFFAQAAAEVANGFIDEALYIKSLSLSESNESKARPLYIRLRAEELQLEHSKQERLNTVAKVVGGAAGLAIGTAQATVYVAKFFPWRRIICSVSSLIIPGSGHYFSGRREEASKFFSKWFWTIVVQIAGAAFFDREVDNILDGPSLIKKALLVLWFIWFMLVLYILPVWAAVDTFIKFSRRHESPDTSLNAASKNH